MIRNLNSHYQEDRGNAKVTQALLSPSPVCLFSHVLNHPPKATLPFLGKIFVPQAITSSCLGCRCLIWPKFILWNLLEAAWSQGSYCRSLKVSLMTWVPSSERSSMLAGDSRAHVWDQPSHQRLWLGLPKGFCLQNLFYDQSGYRWWWRGRRWGWQWKRVKRGKRGCGTRSRAIFWILRSMASITMASGPLNWIPHNLDGTLNVKWFDVVLPQSRRTLHASSFTLGVSSSLITAVVIQHTIFVL